MRRRLTHLFAVVAFLLASTASAETIIITNTKTIAVTPTITSTPYADGDLVGGKLTIAGAARTADDSGMVISVNITDVAANGTALEVVFFDADPTNTTFTDNAAFDIADADMPKVIGTALVNTVTAFADNGQLQIRNLTLPFSGLTDQTLYAAIVARGAATYAAGALTVKFGIIQD